LLESKLRHWPPGTSQNTVRAVLFFQVRLTRTLTSLPDPSPSSAELNRPSDLKRPSDLNRTSAFRPRVLVLAGVLLFVCALGWVGAKAIRRERRLGVLLCHEIERTKGPGEAILVEDRLLAWGLRRLGSAELTKQVVVLREGELSSPRWSAGGEPVEVIVVAAEDSPLLEGMRLRGWRVTPDVSDRPALRLRGRPVMVFFAVRR
jgi:hypothetical protein